MSDKGLFSEIWESEYEYGANKRLTTKAVTFGAPFIFVSPFSSLTSLPINPNQPNRSGRTQTSINQPVLLPFSPSDVLSVLHPLDPVPRLTGPNKKSADNLLLPIFEWAIGELTNAFAVSTFAF